MGHLRGLPLHDRRRRVTIYVVHLETKSSSSEGALRRFRAALKLLLRRFQLRCISIKEIPE